MKVKGIFLKPYQIKNGMGLESWRTTSSNSEFTDIALCHGNCEGGVQFQRQLLYGAVVATSWIRFSLYAIDLNWNWYLLLGLILINNGLNQCCHTLYISNRFFEEITYDIWSFLIGSMLAHNNMGWGTYLFH